MATGAGPSRRVPLSRKNPAPIRQHTKSVVADLRLMMSMARTYRWPLRQTVNTALGRIP